MSHRCWGLARFSQKEGAGGEDKAGDPGQARREVEGGCDTPGFPEETEKQSGGERNEAGRGKAASLFIGARGLNGIERFFIGSVSTYIAAKASCSVEVVR